MRTPKLLIAAFILLISNEISAQAPVIPPAWWIDVHSNWPLEGALPWRYYITESSGYMGPNALPVPESSDAIIPEHPSATISGFAHLSRGDQTINSYIKMQIPFGNRVLFESWYVPVEYFQTDNYTRNIRYSLGEEGKGWAKGDVYVSTAIQFARNKGWKPDIQGRAAFKTASGEKYHEARYTDAPAYYFDLTSAWSMEISKSLSFRPFFSLGFYCWQIQDPKYYQNDALLYSAGLTTTYLGNKVKAYMAGYSGYMFNGDHPVTLRLDYTRKLGKGNLLVQYQYGVRDVYYNSYGLGYQFILSKMNSNKW
jgi:hypothetical protein